VLWLAGDFHLGSAGRVSRSGVGARAIEILAGPGAQVPNPLTWLVGGSQWDFVTATNNYVALYLDPSSVRARVVFHYASNRVLAQRSYDLTV